MSNHFSIDEAKNCGNRKAVVTFTFCKMRRQLVDVMRRKWYHTRIKRILASYNVSGSCGEPLGVLDSKEEK